MTLSRRDLLKLGLGAGAFLAVGGGAKRTSGRGLTGLQESDLIHHTIPSSGERIPAIGIGMRNYRTEWIEEEGRYRRTIEVFHEMGGRVLDTAPSYGDSESHLGRILEELGVREDMFIATKVDRQGREDGVERMEASLDRIGTDYVDLMQVHNLRGWETQLETLRDWKEEGRVRYLGITTSSDRQYEQMARIMEREELDFIQVDYSLGDRSAADRILPMAREREIATLINLPFGRGELFETVEGEPLPDWAGEIDADTWAQVFLKYVISHPAVTVAIPGTTEPGHARDNVGAMMGRLPDPPMRRTIEETYDAL